MGTAQSQTPSSAGNADSETANINAVTTKTPETKMDDSQASATTTTQPEMESSTTANSETTSNTNASTANTTEIKTDNGKTGNTEATHDGARKNKPSRIEAARPHVEALTRVQRALAMKHLPKLEDGIKCEYQSPFDERRASLYPFERQVIFVALYLEVWYNKYGDVRNVGLGIAKLDTDKLDKLPPGRDGEYFEEEVELCFFEEDAAQHDGEALSGQQIGAMRMRVAQACDGSGPKARVSDLLEKRREIVLVTDDLIGLERDLAVIGFNPREHMGIIDIINVPVLEVSILTWYAWYASELPDKAYEMGFCDEPRHPPEVQRDRLCVMRAYSEAEAKAPIVAMVKLALKDIKNDDCYKVFRGGNGGAFPGPFRKIETESERLAYDLERILGMNFLDSGEEIRQCTQALLGDKALPRSDIATQTEPRQEERKSPATASIRESSQNPGPPSLEPPQEEHQARVGVDPPEPGPMAGSSIAASVTQNAQKQHSTSNVPKSTTSQPAATADTGEVTLAAQGGQRPRIILNPGVDTSRRDKSSREHGATTELNVPASAKEEAQSKQPDAVPANKASPSASVPRPVAKTTRKPKSRLIENALFDYHRREEDFADLVRRAVKPYCEPLCEFFEVVEFEHENGEVNLTYKITSPDNHIKLANVLAEHPELISISMISNLVKVIVKRTQVDEWFSSLPATDVQRDDQEIETHRKFRAVLNEAYNILRDALKPQVADLQEQMNRVAAVAKIGRP